MDRLLGDAQTNAIKSTYVDRCKNCASTCDLPTLWSHQQEYRDKCVQCGCGHFEAEIVVSIDE